MTELEGVPLAVARGETRTLAKDEGPTVILKAEPLDPTFKWRGHKPERRPWRSIGLLLVLAIAVGAGFLVGRLSTAATVPAHQRTAEQHTASAGGAGQSQVGSQSEVTAALRTSTVGTDTKPAAQDEMKASAAASSTETPKAQFTTSTEKGSASPPVVLINPSTADKAVVGDTAKKAAPKTEAEVPAKATARTDAYKAADDAAPAAKRQARSLPPAHANTNAAPLRQESAAVRRDDAYSAPRRDDAYVPPRVPQSTLTDQRERYDGAGRDEDRARVEQPYRDRRYPEPDPRYAEDGPLPRGAYEDSRGYLRPFQGYRDFREYRRFEGYDGDPYADRRPVLRPMYGGGPVY